MQIGGTMISPKLIDVEQVCDGWVKKYLMTYELPDGSLYEYHAATRHGKDEYLAHLRRNGAKSEKVMEALRDAGPSSASGAPGETAPFVPDAVCIAARTPRDTLVMIREFRYPLNSWCIAFPAGLVDPNEDIFTCANRELQEETGYSIIDGTARALPQPGYSSTGLTDETVQVILAEAEKAGDAHTEGNEYIEVFELPVSDVRHFLEENELPIGTRAQLILELFACSSEE